MVGVVVGAATTYLTDYLKEKRNITRKERAMRLIVIDDLETNVDLLTDSQPISTKFWNDNKMAICEYAPLISIQYGSWTIAAKKLFDHPCPSNPFVNNEVVNSAQKLIKTLKKNSNT